MQASNNAVALIKHFESCSLKAYLCPAKKWTVGWGNTFYENETPIRAGDFIGQKRADRMLSLEISNREKAVNRALKVKVSQNLFDGLVSWTYNFSESKLKNSNLLRLINDGSEIDEITTELRRWEHVGDVVKPGLTRRRMSEEHLIKTGELKFYF